MRRNLKVILLSLMPLFCLLESPAWVHAETVLRVGILASLSGSQTQVGQELKDGALLAIEHLNKEWKGKGVRIEAAVMDDGASPGKAKEAASWLIREGKVDILFGLADSDAALAVMPMVNQVQIPLLTMATHADLTHPLKKWIFRGNISDDDQAKILVDLMWEKIPEKKIALLYEESAYGRSGAGAELKRIRQYQASPVAEVAYPRGEKDFSAALARIKATGAEGLLIYGVASDAPSMLKQIHELGLDVRIMASSGWDTNRLSGIPHKLTDGVIVAGYLPFAKRDRDEVLGPSWVQFAQAFQERFHREPDVMAALSYSNMMVLGEAYTTVDFQRQRLVEGLEETKAFNTLLESRITFSDEGRDGIRLLHLAEFRDGKPGEWKRNQFARDHRFTVPGRLVSVGEYRGKIYEGQPGIAIWMLLHFAFGRPPFMKEFPMIDEYGIKSCFVGALFKGQVRVPVFKLIFRSEKEAIEALNLESSAPEGRQPGEGEPGAAWVNFRNADSGLYSDGTFWAGYQRIKNMLVLAGGEIPLEDLRMILDAGF